MKFISCHLQLLKLSPRCVKNHRWKWARDQVTFLRECNPILDLGSESWTVMHQHRVADWCSAEADTIGVKQKAALLLFLANMIALTLLLWDYCKCTTVCLDTQLSLHLRFVFHILQIWQIYDPVQTWNWNKKSWKSWSSYPYDECIGMISLRVLQKHRVIEWVWLEGTLKTTLKTLKF